MLYFYITFSSKTKIKNETAEALVEIYTSYFLNKEKFKPSPTSPWVYV